MSVDFQPQFEVRRLEPPIGLPKLNETQFKAVEKALEHNFTVIQGPPGKSNKYIFFKLSLPNIMKQYNNEPLS